MKYYISKEPCTTSNFHEVHEETCMFLPISNNRLDLGEHNSDTIAINYAKSLYSTVDVDGCIHCCKNSSRD